MAFDHIRVIRISQIEFCKIPRAKGNKMVAIGFMQHTFATDLMDFDPAPGTADRNLATQGVAVVYTADCCLHMGGLAGMVMIKTESRDELFIDVQTRNLGDFSITVPVLDIERPREGGRGKAGAHQGGHKDVCQAQWKGRQLHNAPV